MPPSATAPAIRPAPSARRRNARSRGPSPSRAASAARYTAAKYAQLATASAPMKTEVGFNQLENRGPVALPMGTRSVAIAPIAAPSANGVSTEETEKIVSITPDSRAGGTGAERVGGAPED